MKRFVIAMIFVVVVAGLATRSDLCILRHFGNDAQLVWNDDEALLFIGNHESAWSMSYAEYGLEFLKAFLFRAVRLADVTHRWLTVVRYTDAGTTVFTVENLSGVSLTVVDGHIYDGDVRKWTGDRFESTTDAEAERVHQAWRTYDRHAPGGGWEFMGAVLRRAESESRFPMTISGKSVDWIVKRTNHSESISLKVGEATPETVWFADDRVKYVKRSEYDRVAKSEQF